MGARNFYVVDVYDVARDGTTQKSTGRIFYTKGKSLIFYAYDLEQEPGAKSGQYISSLGDVARTRQRKRLRIWEFSTRDNAGPKKVGPQKLMIQKLSDEIDAVFRNGRTKRREPQTKWQAVAFRLSSTRLKSSLIRRLACYRFLSSMMADLVQARVLSRRPKESHQIRLPEEMFLCAWDQSLPLFF